jgi:hypothetical protein
MRTASSPGSAAGRAVRAAVPGRPTRRAREPSTAPPCSRPHGCGPGDGDRDRNSDRDGDGDRDRNGDGDRDGDGHRRGHGP